MATAYFDDDKGNVEDCVNCSVCLNEYNEETRKPKFLPCTHTFCVSCLKEISQKEQQEIKCPVCCQVFVRLEVNVLPNNKYPLLILEQNKKMLLKLASSWCLTCGSTEKPGCASSGHASVPWTADTQDLGGFIKLKEDLLKMKDKTTNILAMAIEERRKVQNQLAKHQDELAKLTNENNIQITQLVSILERSGSKAGDDFPPGKKTFLSELMSLVEGSTTEDDAETLKQKMKKSIELYEKKLSEAKVLAKRFLELKSAQTLFSANATKSTLPPSIPSSSDIEKFVLNDSSFFILRIKQGHVFKGEIMIHPVPTFPHRDFMQKLGEFCFRTQQVVCSKEYTALSQVVVAFPMKNDQFQPVTSVNELDTMRQTSINIHDDQGSFVLANQIDEVGIDFFIQDKKIVLWRFIFPLENFKNFRKCELFGLACSPVKESLGSLAKIPNSKRTEFTVTVKSGNSKAPMQ